MESRNRKRRQGLARARAIRLVPILLGLILTIAIQPAAASGKNTASVSKGLQVGQAHPAQRPAFWGAWIGDQLTGEKPPWDMRPVAELESLLGKGLSLLSLGSPFADCDPAPCRFFEFPTDAMDNVYAYGAIPVFNWSSQESAVNPSLTTSMPNFQLSDVASGRYDAYIRRFAEDARDWGHPYFLRFDWEMNGTWFPWSEQVNGNAPGEFVTTWRHVHDVFTSVGATNATWVWCPYAEIRRSFAPLKPLYPGDDYVDWTCMDGFNWAANQTNPHKWKTFAQIFSTTYRHILRKIAPGKPIMLAEMASTGPPRAKAIWIANMFKQLARYRRIRALIWFEQIDRGIDWPLETSAAALRAFGRGIRNPGFQANAQAAISSPIQPPH